MWSGSKPLPFGPDGAERLLHRRVQGRGLRLMARVGAMALAAAVLSAGALNLATILAAPQHEIVQSFATETTPQAWTEINHPIALYDLSGTEFAKLPRIARARRHQPDGAREDMLTFGALGLPKPFLRLSVLRTTGHIGAAQDIPARTGPPSLLPTIWRASRVPQRECHGAAGEAAISTRLGAMTWPTYGSGTMAFLRLASAFVGFPAAATACGSWASRAELRASPSDAPPWPARSTGSTCSRPATTGRLRSIFVAAEREAASSCSEGRIRSTGGLMTALGARRTWLDRDADLPPLRGLLEASNNRH